MGAWSPSILGNDTSCEIRERFFDIYNSGVEAKDIISIIVEEQQGTIDCDKTNFWIGLALACWECQALTQELYNTVKNIVESGEDLQFNRELEADEKFIKERDKALRNFLTKISKAKNKARKRKSLPRAVTTDYKVGQCYAYKNQNGSYIGIYITRSEHYRFKGNVSFVFLNLESRNKPQIEDFISSKLYGLEKLGYDWGEREYGGNQVGFDYEKKNKEDFFHFCSKRLIQIGATHPINVNKMSFNYRWHYMNFEQHDSVIDVLEKTRMETISQFPVSSISLGELLDKF